MRTAVKHHATLDGLVNFDAVLACDVYVLCAVSWAYLQLLGCVIAVFGMIYAFYVKPILKQRRREAVYARGKTSSNAEVSA